MKGKDWEHIEYLTYWREREVSQLQAALLGSFQNFVHYCIKKRFGVKPTRIQLDIAKWMEEGPEQRGVMAFRNATKTTIASLFCDWWTYRDPRVTIRVISGSDDLAKEVTAECRIWYEVIDVLQEINPSHNLGTRDMLDNARAFNVYGCMGGKSSTFTATSISGTVTGGRAHISLMDDIETPNNCGTAAKRETLKNRDTEVHNLMHSADSSGLYPGFVPFTMYLGTPHTEESIYYYSMNQGYSFRVWPARYPNENFMKTIGGLVTPMLLDDLKEDPSLGTGYGPNEDEGRVTETERFSEDHFIKKRIKNGSAGFAKQFMLDVSLQNIDKYPLKVKDLIVADLDSKKAKGGFMLECSPQYECKGLMNAALPGDTYYTYSWASEEVRPYENIIMAVDTSGAGADETSYAIVGTLNGYIYLLYSSGKGAYSKGYSEEILTDLVEKAKEFQVKEIFVESNFGGGTISDLLKPLLNRTYPCTVTESRAVGQKELRIIDTLEPIMNRHRLIVDRKVIERDYENLPEAAPETEQVTYRLMYQLARISREKGALAHDDRLDALELAVRQVAYTLGIDEAKAEELKAERERMMKGNLFHRFTGEMKNTRRSGNPNFLRRNRRR